MGFRATVGGVQVAGSPPDRYHLVHVFDEGLIIGPPYATATGTVRVLTTLAATVPVLVGWFGWVAGNRPMMVAAAVLLVTLAAAALAVRWRIGRVRWPGPPASALSFDAAGGVAGADLIDAARIVWAATQPRLDIPGARGPEAREGVVVHLADGAALTLNGPDGLADAVRSIPGLVTTDPDGTAGPSVHVIRPD